VAHRATAIAVEKASTAGIAVVGANDTSPDLAGFGFLIVVMRPDLLGPAETFRQNVSTFAQAVRTARPVTGGDAVRMPFDRSRQDRRRRLTDDRIDLPDVLFEQLTRIAGPEPA
jgi:LDH2 family malate/lactate/ureidoglycolate dehydrogenase